MSITRRYSYDWISGLPGLGRSHSVIQDHACPEGWLSSIQTWTAYVEAAIEAQDICLDQCARRFPIRALPAGLRIMSTASQLGEAVCLLSSFGRLADLPWRLDLNSEGETCQLSFSLEGGSGSALADLEVLMLGFLMAALNWLVGEKLPFDRFYSRSAGFAAGHSLHPDFGCGVSAAGWTGVRFSNAYLSAPCIKDGVEESVTETLIWLVYDHPEDMILPRHQGLDVDSEILRLKVADFPVFNDVGARQKRRNLISESGMTLRDLKQKFIVRRAKVLLLSPCRKLSDIALELGYSDEASFRRFFKNATGVSPREFCRSEEYNVLQYLSKISHLSTIANA